MRCRSKVYSREDYCACVSHRRAHSVLGTYLSRFLGTNKPSSVNGGESTELVGLSCLVMLLERRLDWEKRAATGESAGKGLRRTGDWTAIGTGCDDVWERKAAKDCMAMEASVEGFWRGGEA